MLDDTFINMINQQIKAVSEGVKGMKAVVAPIKNSIKDYDKAITLVDRLLEGSSPDAMRDYLKTTRDYLVSMKTSMCVICYQFDFQSRLSDKFMADVKDIKNKEGMA